MTPTPPGPATDDGLTDTVQGSGEAIETTPTGETGEVGNGTVGRYEVVVVTYYSRAQLESMLASVRPEQRVVVVDNVSGADGVPEVVDRLSHGRWIDGGDSGYAKAANRGVQTSTAEFVVFANADSLPTPEIWETLVEQLDSDPGLGTVAAATVNPSGHIEIGVGGWEPTPLRCLVYAVGLHRLFTNAGVYARPEIGEDVRLQWLTGACLAVRRQVFLDLGGFDERYFVYNEDMSFGRTVREAGLRQILRTDLLVPHAAGGSGGGSTKMSQQKGASMAHYLDDHNKALPAAVMRGILASGMAGRLLAAIGRGRRDTARIHAAYIRGILTRKSPYTS